MSTVKTVVIVGAVGVGAYWLFSHFNSIAAFSGFVSPVKRSRVVNAVDDVKHVVGDVKSITSDGLSIWNNIKGYFTTTDSKAAGDVQSAETGTGMDFFSGGAGGAFDS